MRMHILWDLCSYVAILKRLPKISQSEEGMKEASGQVEIICYE